MARKSNAEKAASRENIVAAAARLIRQSGIDETSVAAIMQAAGMTHGGFYRHFESKDDLVTAAVTESFKAGLDEFSEHHDGTPDEAEAYIAQYLSDDHVEQPDIGCPIPLLGAEIARGTDTWQRALADGVATATRKLGEGLPGLSRADVLTLFSTLVGTVVLSRAVGDGALRAELLAANREHVAKAVSAANRKP
ncbi:MAG: TetR/AcrR family transcriptional regulator [Pseudomonadota bacterium]